MQLKAVDKKSNVFCNLQSNCILFESCIQNFYWLRARPMKLGHGYGKYITTLTIYSLYYYLGSAIDDVFFPPCISMFFVQMGLGLQIVTSKSSDICFLYATSPLLADFCFFANMHMNVLAPLTLFKKLNDRCS
jgi:hypothetical protein